ncbi:MAG: hypothetical protein MZU91_00145 [Desulfosudis oleivorans]|nr:hypothetical protein [Desulfosudis oleivorans]
MTEASMGLVKAAVEECGPPGLAEGVAAHPSSQGYPRRVPSKRHGKDKDDVPNKEKGRIMDAALEVFSRGRVPPGHGRSHRRTGRGRQGIGIALLHEQGGPHQEPSG